MMQKIYKDQIFLSSLKDRMKFHYLRGKGHLFSYAWNRFQWYNYPRLRRISRFPLHVDVEISSVCDMQCPMCYTRTDDFKDNVKKRIMDIGLFRKIIDECAKKSLFSIRLSLRGEPLLNPHIVEMLKYAKSKGIHEVSMLTNSLKLDKNIFEQFVDYGLDWLTISVDGWGQTYESIRKPAKFDLLYAKIIDFAAIKKIKKSLKPVIKVQSIWPAIQNDPQYFYSLFKPYVDEVASNPLIDFLREDTEIEYIADFTCPYLWQRMSIGADGTILMCQCDEMEENILGNADEDSIEKIWHGKELNHIRKRHIDHKGCRELKPCMHCAYPRIKVVKKEIRVEDRKIVVEKYAGRKESIISQGGDA